MSYNNAIKAAALDGYRRPLWQGYALIRPKIRGHAKN
jgi:hypothetical protein